jgi:ABC-type transporter Mla MlaB component
VSSPTRPEPSSGILVVDGPVADDDVALLCARLRSLLNATAADVVVDVRTLAADAVTIEALARLQLTARRLGRRITLRRASPDLDRLVSFVGLADVLPGCTDGVSWHIEHHE